MKKQIKKPIQSKLLWFNFLSIMAIIITELSASIELKEALGSYAVWLMVAGSAINFGLRLVTDSKIGFDDNNPVEKALQAENDLTKNI